MIHEDGRIGCIEVTRPDVYPGMLCIYRADSFDAVAEFDGAEEGEEIILTLRFLTEQELEDIPEFEGW